jgi:hypothetical protein
MRGNTHSVPFTTDRLRFSEKAASFFLGAAQDTYTGKAPLGYGINKSLRKEVNSGGVEVSVMVNYPTGRSWRLV